MPRGYGCPPGSCLRANDGRKLLDEAQGRHGTGPGTLHFFVTAHAVASSRRRSNRRGRQSTCTMDSLSGNRMMIDTDGRRFVSIVPNGPRKCTRGRHSISRRAAIRLRFQLDPGKRRGRAEHDRACEQRHAVGRTEPAQAPGCQSTTQAE